MTQQSQELCNVRIVGIYATAWRYEGKAYGDLSAALELGGLKRYYHLYRPQLPQLLDGLLPGDRIDPSEVRLRKPVPGIAFSRADVMLFALPSSHIVFTLTLEFTTHRISDPSLAKPVTAVLEQTIDGEVSIGDKTVADLVGSLRKHTAGSGPLVKRIEDKTTDDFLLPERHQLVFISSSEKNGPVLGDGVVDEIVYLDKAPYREEFSHQKNPEQLNRHRHPDTNSEHGIGNLIPHRRQKPSAKEVPTTLGVVTSYISLLYGHERYVENSIFLSTVHAVGTASRFRQIWREAYEQVRVFRGKDQEQTTGSQTRDGLECLADNLGNLEFDLTFSVEFPLMRIETFQTALYEAMDLSNQAQALSKMFDQIRGSLRSEITAIEAREQRRNEGRQKWNAFAISFLSLLGVPVGVVIAFLGINTSEIPDTKISMWNDHFAPLYLVSILFALTPAFLITVPYLHEWVDGHSKFNKQDKRNKRALKAGLATLAVGIAGFAGAVFFDPLGHIRPAICVAASAVIALDGLTLVGLWARHTLSFFGQPGGQ